MENSKEEQKTYENLCNKIINITKDNIPKFETMEAKEADEAMEKMNSELKDNFILLGDFYFETALKKTNSTDRKKTIQ